jgi:hypothetical protein
LSEASETAYVVSGRYGGASADERRTARRERLLDAAFESLGRGGWRETTVRGVCETAGLKPRVRELYGLSWSRAQELAFRATVEAMRRSRPFVPRRVRQGANADAYDLVARTERRRIERGEPTPQVAA